MKESCVCGELEGREVSLYVDCFVVEARGLLGTGNDEWRAGAEKI
jgi:hypothetical protein